MPVLQDELAVRRDRAIDRHTRAAGFREHKTLEDFDWEFNKSVKRKQVFDLAAGEFVRRHRDLLLIGPPGVGKSHLAQAIGLALVRAGHAVYYRSIFDAVRDMSPRRRPPSPSPTLLRASERQLAPTAPRRLHDEAFDGHERVMARSLRPDLLILDDMGMKHLPKRSGEYLFEIIMRRHELKSTLMTSNRPLEDWGKLVGDVPAATAILDRFLQAAEIVEITGRSFRLRGAKRPDPQSTVAGD